MKKLRNAIQKGEFTQEEIRDISERMAELGISKEYETEMENMNFGKYLSNVVGEPPEDMINPHAHHILFKTGNGTAQHALVEEGQAILRKHGIDQVVGTENLIWAPNAVTGQHDITALEQVVDTLGSIDEDGGGYDDIVDALAELGDIASQR